MRSQSVQPQKSSNQIDLPSLHKHGSFEEKYDQSQFPINCNCKICQEKNNNDSQPKEPKIDYASYKDKMMFFLGCLSKSKKNPGYKIEILETCFYQNGKPLKFYINGEATVEQYKLKSKTSSQVFNVLIDNSHRVIQKWNWRSMQLLFVRNLHLLIDLPVIHQKFIRSVIPSHLQSFSSGFKKPRHLEVHNNKRLLINSIDQNRKHQNVSIVYFSDGSCCVLNQIKLRQLLLTPNNGNIPYLIMVTCYIQPKSKSKRLYSHYSASDKSIKQSYLYTFACREVEVELGILSHLDEQFPTDQEIQDIKKQFKEDIQKSVDYQTYRMVAYLERQVNINTQELILGWVIGIDNLQYLCFVYDFKYQYRFIEDVPIRDPKLVNRSLEKDLMHSWEITKQLKAFQRQKKLINVRKQSQLVFKELFPDGDFESLNRYNPKSLIRTHRKNRLIHKNTYESGSSQQRQKSKTPLTKITIDRSTNVRSRNMSRNISRNVSINVSRNVSSLSRNGSLSVSPRRNG